MTTPQIVALVLGSGVVSGLAGALVAYLTGRSERMHRTSERTAVEEHEARLRRELAHDQARENYLAVAVQLATWFNQSASATHWEEVGSFYDMGTGLPMPTTNVEVLDRLRQVMYGHPSRRVRDHAHKLFGDIHTQWTEIKGSEIPEPTLDQQIDWFNRAEELIELIQAPEGTRS